MIMSSRRLLHGERNDSHTQLACRFTDHDTDSARLMLQEKLKSARAEFVKSLERRGGRAIHRLITPRSLHVLTKAAFFEARSPLNEVAFTAGLILASKPVRLPNSTLSIAPRRFLIS